MHKWHLQKHAVLSNVEVSWKILLLDSLVMSSYLLTSDTASCRNLRVWSLKFSNDLPEHLSLKNLSFGQRHVPFTTACKYITGFCHSLEKEKKKKWYGEKILIRNWTVKSQSRHSNQLTFGAVSVSLVEWPWQSPFYQPQDCNMETRWSLRCFRKHNTCSCNLFSCNFMSHIFLSTLYMLSHRYTLLLPHLPIWKLKQKIS